MKERPLWNHQTEAIERARELECFALFFEVGTGKTRTCIEIVKQKNLKHKRTLRTLVLTPSVVCFNWKKEFSEFSDIRPEHILVLHGTGADRLRQLERTPNYFIVIANYESLLMEPIFSQLKLWNPEVVIADESHRIKNPRAQRTRRAVALSALAQYRYLLSGTPILQNQSDLFAQYLFMDQGKTLGKNFFTFRQLYFTDKNAALRKQNRLVNWPEWVPKKARESEFQSKVMSLAMAVKKSECLDLPPYICQTVEVEMSSEQARAYKQMRDDYITFIKSRVYTAQLAITKALRLQQIASGFLMDEEKTHVFENTPKEKALIELLSDITPNHKVIIWACWRANHATIGNLLDRNGYEWRGVFGDAGAAQRDRSISDFREDDKVRVLVGSQGAMGIGINLVEASHSIFYSRNFSLEQDLQAEARSYRGGSERHASVHRIDLITRGTIDESVSEALLSKQEISEKILGGGMKI